VAFTVDPLIVPRTITPSPFFSAERPPFKVPDAFSYVVDDVTSTVSFVPLKDVMVNEFEPMEAIAPKVPPPAPPNRPLPAPPKPAVIRVAVIVEPETVPYTATEVPFLREEIEVIPVPEKVVELVTTTVSVEP
jgi:hypothetical protein